MRTQRADKPTQPPHGRPIAAAALMAFFAAAEAGCETKPAPAASPPTAAQKPAAAGPPTGAQGERSSVEMRQDYEAQNPVKTAKVELARLSPDVDLVGSVAPSQDHVALIGPLVSGRIAKLNAGVGDLVRKGQILAEIESAEVGQAKAEYLTALAKLHAAEANLRRESDLAAKRISSEREREVAVASAETERAGLKASIERLRAIGFQPADIDALARDRDAGGRVPIRASIGGTVIARMVTLGEAVERANDAFKIADLRTLWVLLDLYEKDLAKVFVGQKVELRTEAYRGEVFKAKVAYIEPVIDVETRTAKVRIEFENVQGKLRLGQLVTAHILGDPSHATGDVVAVPRSAVQRVDGKSIVFVRDAEKRSFAKRMIELGTSGGELVEVRQGLAVGEEVATDGAFLIKSELLR